jgi:DNA-directed RNA polymerase specialized sigma subunit
MFEVNMTEKNPILTHLETKEAARTERKEKEMELWKRWRQTGKPEHLEPLLQAYEPLLSQKMRAWRAPFSAPESAFRGEIQKHLINAFETYDPKKGAALNTHVHYRIQKAMRYNAKHQNLAYIPAGQTKLITPIKRAIEELREEYGRDPTHSEIATHLQMNGEEDFRNITAKRVETVLKAQRTAVPSSHLESDPTAHFPGFEDQQIAVAATILPDIFPGKDDLHKLFNHTFGTNGFQQITSTSQLAKKLGKTDQQISHMKTQMGNALRKHMGLEEDDE